MWEGPKQDPGGGPDLGPSEPPSTSKQELSDLKDQFEQQQLLIVHLKDMIRKSEQTKVTQEKVDEYMNTLSKRSAMAKRSKKDDDNRKSADIPASEKISLLRQQVEENKAKFAERGKSQKGIEEMVTQLKAQLDDSQQLINQTPLNLPLPETKYDYSENSSAQELYTILLTKEKRINDLTLKVQKLESNVFDLQENVKEKDSVIDARTKAITLMTENLSKKSKTSLDALDETKEQMRKMQENFVALEADMKARQKKLLEDLKLKNYEINDLQEINSNLQKENLQLKENTNNEEINALQNKINELEKLNSKLQQENYFKLDFESIKAENENLILNLAQRETTIKDLKDEINQLKSNEDNEEIAKLKKQLDDSNKNMIKVKAQHKSKIKELNKRIEAFKKISDVNAEVVKLESEICQLNQKVAELEEEKGTLQLKLVDFESKGSETPEREKELEEQLQDQTRLLEEKDKIISFLEAEITNLKNENDGLNEKLSRLSHLENAQVTSEITSIQYEEQMDSLEHEKQKLIIENESTTKEKKELLENIEVLKKEKQEIIDKLEHYIQENMDLMDKLEKLSAEKVSSAESIEIVEGLTQQEKLELEAYQKNLEMVTGTLKLSEENLPQTVDLNESVNELTEETSELLQKIELFTVERREVMEKMEQLKQDNNHLNLKFKEIENIRDVLAETYEQLQSEKDILDAKLEALESENAILKQQFKSGDKNKHEIETEIGNYKLTIEENQKEIDKLSATIKELQQQLDDKEIVIKQLNNNIIDLNRTILEFEIECTDLGKNITQLEEQKNTLSEELETVSREKWENRRLVEDKDNEILKLIKERDNSESVISDLHRIIAEKDEQFHKVSSEIKDKYLALQKQLEENSGNIQNLQSPLENKIVELTNKNKEQLEKMKKIAANLKKKSQAYQELEDQTKVIQEKHENELREKDMKLNDAENKIITLLQQLQDLENEVSTLQKSLDIKTQEYNCVWKDLRILAENRDREVNELEVQIGELQHVIADLKMKLQINEINLQQELLQTQPDLENVQNITNDSTLQNKIQELEMIIETQENELVNYKERVNKLEEGIASIEERRLSLERKTNELGAQLEEKSISCEEMTMSGDMLEKRLESLIIHDEIIAKKLEEALGENQDLNQQVKKLSDKNDKLKKKLELTLENVKTVENLQTTIDDLEGQNDVMKKQISQLEEELKHLQIEYERNLEENKNEYDKINSDWQMQFDEIVKEKTELMIKCEQFEEEIREITEKEIGFNDELIAYKTKLEKSEDEICNYEAQMQILKQQNEELEQLRQIINEKNLEIDSYQQQKQQNTPSLSSFFDSTTPQQNVEELQLTKQKLEEELIKLHNELESSKLQIIELEKTVRNLEVKKTAESTISSVIFAAEEKVSTQKDVPTIVWSEQQSDPFDLIVSQQQKVEEDIVVTQEPPLQAKPKIENTQEELLNKIKTLEFMLYSMEKDKDDTLLQCHELSNELTRLVYERENKPQPSLESQILQENQIVDTPDTAKQLQQMEFETTKLPLVSSFDPIVEETFQAKDAYLCFNNENTATKLDSQILSEAEITDTPTTRQELQQIEFEETRAPISATPQPVQEQQMTEKDAYLCYTGGDGAARDTFGENDDGWGWGPDEGRLEEEHVRKMDDGPVGNLKEKIQVLEIERENHLEEIKQLQIKSGKLIKKLKEFKQKNEQLNQRKKSEGDLFNLDEAIQEELKLQIQQIEKKLKETVVELEKEKNEKSALLKRIDVLTAANERMIEMKEKQDVELLGWQRNYKELNTKLERFEWGDDGFSSTDHKTEETVAQKNESHSTMDDLNKKIQELNETIKDLTLDNEELQTLLEEQRTLRIDAEKAKSVEPIPSNMKTESEYLEVVNDRDALQNQLLLSGEEKKQLQDQVNELTRKYEELIGKFHNIQKQNEELNALIISKEETILSLTSNQAEDLKTIEELTTKLETTETEKIDFIQNLKMEENGIISEYKQQIDELQSEKNTIFSELQEKNIQINLLKESMNTQIIHLKEELEKQTEVAQSLLQQNKTLTETIEIKDAELNTLNNELSLKHTEITTTIEKLNNEWGMRVDQRGNDVAESWKLHLESRETEFAQIEEMLKNEINRLEEEKTNALTSQSKNDLTEILQEKQTEIDALHQKLSQLMETKNQEISHLQEDLKTKEEELAIVKRNCNEYKEQVGVLNASEALLQQTIASLNNQLREVENLKDYNDENTQNLQQNLLEYQHQLQVKSAQLEEVISERQHLRQLLQDKEVEISNLMQQLDEKQKEHAFTLESLSQNYQITHNGQMQEIEILKRRLADNENHYEELLISKDSEIGSLTLQLNENTNSLENKIKELNTKIEECKSLQGQIDEQNVLLEDERKQLIELRGIIEEQVMKIEELKQELFEKSNDYDSLIAEMDISRTSQQNKEHEISRTSQLEEDDLTEPVSRAELDLALYMLHQRDVRCEELTVELTQLLEERDTLQLRLSNAIREKEELGKTIKSEEETEIGSTSTTGTIPKIPLSNVKLDSEKTTENDHLATKLSELKTVGYRRDKRIVDEQEVRRMQQLSIMQQHRDVASKLPPEAAARLVDASYTLSRDVQSPSKVLLNWLWGKSTPKVNNI